MHACPRCGMACDCDGDDLYVECWDDCDCQCDEPEFIDDEMDED